MKSLDFNNTKKHYLSVTLADEEKTVLLIGTPTKRVMDELLSLKDSLDAFEEDTTDVNALDDLYTACAKIMSRNKDGIKVDKKFLEELFDIEDIIVFFDAYMDFVETISNSKN